MGLKNFCSPLRKTLLCVLVSLPLLAQGSGYVSVGQPAKLVGQRNATVQTKIPVTVQSGIHVQSNKPTEEYLIPLKLTWKSTGALTAGTVVYPKPTLQKYEFAQKPLSVLEGTFDLVASFKVAPNASAGPGAVAGELRYQACNDRACFRPMTVSITVPYQIQ